jgi:hypothetical protein
MFSRKFFARACPGRIAVALILLLSPVAFAQTAAKKMQARATKPEQRAAHAFEAARANPRELHAFLLKSLSDAPNRSLLEGGEVVALL